MTYLLKDKTQFYNSEQIIILRNVGVSSYAGDISARRSNLAALYYFFMVIVIVVGLIERAAIFTTGL